MERYVIKFSKEGSICYISHLDMLRLFKRAFKKAEIKLDYSQGFNPHPKMGFAQPLSLGYSSVCEYLEFETTEKYDPENLIQVMKDQMPDGIKITACTTISAEMKSLAASTQAAEYIIGIPYDQEIKWDNGEALCSAFFNQPNIYVEKRQKKTKKMVEIDIKDKIQSLNCILVNNNIIMTALLDSGSNSNLSPELLITAWNRFHNIETERSEIDVMRKKIIFLQKLPNMN